MRAGISLSAGLHVGVIAIALIGLPSLFDREAPAEMVVAVTVVAETAEPESEPPPAEPAPEPKPEPKPEPPPPEPPPAPEPPPPPPEPEPPPPPPEPEPPPPPPEPEPPPPPPEPEPPPPPPEPEPPPPPPEPEPKPEPKPKPKPEPEPEPEPKGADVPAPKAKPKPVQRQVAKAVPAPRRKPKPPPDAFDTLLRDLERQRKTAGQTPPRQARPAPAPGPQGGLDRRRLIASLVERIREQVWPCWNLPIGIKDAHKLRVEIKIELNPDGTLVGSPRVVDRQRLTADPVFRAYAESAVRALQNPDCRPLRLPLDSYRAWREISLNFDSRELLR